MVESDEGDAHLLFYFKFGDVKRELCFFWKV